MSKKTTISDIARALGITPSAVSKALNKHPRISQETRKAVEEMAIKMNYQRNQLATALRKGSSRLIGVVVPATNLSFFSTIIKGIEDVAQQNGYHVIISQSKDLPELEASNLDMLANIQVDGILATIANKTTSFGHFDRIKNKQIPLVLFDRSNRQLGVSDVVIDDYRGAYKATAHLAEQGYQKIAHMAGYQHVLPYKNRLAGYLDALRDYGLAAIQGFAIESGLEIEDGRKIAEQLLALPAPPDAFFSSSDTAALGVFQVAQSKGLHVPQQVGIVGFSNEPFTALLSPSLSSIDQHSETMGQTAAQLLLNQLKLSDDEAFIPQQIVLDPDLVIRDSSRRF